VSWRAALKSVLKPLAIAAAPDLAMQVEAFEQVRQAGQLGTVARLGAAQLVSIYAPAAAPLVNAYLTGGAAQELDTPLPAYMPPPMTTPAYMADSGGFFSNVGAVLAAAGRDIKEGARGYAPETVGAIEEVFDEDQEDQGDEDQGEDDYDEEEQ